jgi:hypothetical protein
MDFVIVESSNIKPAKYLSWTVFFKSFNLEECCVKYLQGKTVVWLRKQTSLHFIQEVSTFYLNYRKPWIKPPFALDVGDTARLNYQVGLDTHLALGDTAIEMNKADGERIAL